MLLFEGCGTALMTPFRNGKIDFPVLRRLVARQLDAGAGAFFFDNLMMMLHYAYSCTYYTARMDIYCGKKLAASEKKMADQMVRFILNGLGYQGEY